MTFIRKSVAIGPHDQVYLDDVSDRRRTLGAQFPDRESLLKQLRPGDSVVVATPGRLGIGRDDIRAVLHTLQRKSAPLMDASTGRSLVWTDAVADALLFFDRAAIEHKQDAAKAARGALANMGVLPVRGQKPLALPDDEARLMWMDEIRWPSGKRVAALCGVTQRTLYNRFGKRRLEPTPKKLTPSMKAPQGRNYIYVMSRRDGLHKIGFSTDPLVRRTQLEAVLRQPLRLAHFVLRAGDARAAETIAHSYLRSFHRGGEWFEVDLEKAKKHIEIACGELDVRNVQAWRRSVIDAAERTASRELSRQEITELLKSTLQRDEIDAG
jgi:hypothetical protein